MENGEYYLHLRGNKYLGYENEKLLKFSTESIKAGLRFSDLRGYIARYLVTDRVYFPVITKQIEGKPLNLYLYATTNQNEFRLDNASNLNGRLFIFFPKGTDSHPGEYTFGCNLSGYFYIHGDKLESSKVAAFGVHITDEVHLTKPGQDNCDLLAKDCTADCSTKLCSDDDGCGLPCGCHDNNICLLSGECVDIQAKYRELITRLTPSCPPAVIVPQYDIWSIVVLLIFIILSIVLIYGIIVYATGYGGNCYKTELSAEKKENI